MPETYPFRREDNGETEYVDFETMMSASNGWITLPGGVEARCIHAGVAPPSEPDILGKTVPLWNRPHVSLALGCLSHEVDKRRAEARRAGFTSVEFVRRTGKDAYGYECRIGCPSEFQKYAKHRGQSIFNGESQNAMHLSDQDLANLEQKMIEKYGPPRAANA